MNKNIFIVHNFPFIKCFQQRYCKGKAQKNTSKTKGYKVIIVFNKAYYYDII